MRVPDYYPTMSQDISRILVAFKIHVGINMILQNNLPWEDHSKLWSKQVEYYNNILDSIMTQFHTDTHDLLRDLDRW